VDAASGEARRGSIRDAALRVDAFAAAALAFGATLSAYTPALPASLVERMQGSLPALL
jgi:hypothetical protein